MRFALLLIFSTSVSAAPPELIRLRESARLVVLKSHCAGCHNPSLASAKPEALKIYDLSQRDWSSSLDDRQLSRFKNLESATAKEIKEMRGDPIKNALSAGDKKTLAKFLDSEFKFRKSNPNDRLKDLEDRSVSQFMDMLNGSPSR